MNGGAADDGGNNESGHGGNEEPGVLRPDPRLWAGSAALSGGSQPPDLTPSLWYNLGLARARLGEWQGGAGAFERAAGCLPSHPAVLHELAKAYMVREGGGLCMSLGCVRIMRRPACSS